MSLLIDSHTDTDAIVSDICIALGLDAARWADLVAAHIASYGAGKRICTQTWGASEGNEAGCLLKAMGTPDKVSATYWHPDRFPGSTDKRFYRDYTFGPDDAAISKVKARVIAALRDSDEIELLQALGAAELEQASTRKLERSAMGRAA